MGIGNHARLFCKVLKELSHCGIFLDLIEEAEQIISQKAQGGCAYLGIEGIALVLAEFKKLFALLEAYLDSPPICIFPDYGGCMKMRVSREKGHPLGTLVFADPFDITVLWLAIILGKDYGGFLSALRQGNGCPCNPKPCPGVLPEQRFYLLVQFRKAILPAVISISNLRILEPADDMKILADFPDSTDEPRPGIPAVKKHIPCGDPMGYSPFQHHKGKIKLGIHRGFPAHLTADTSGISHTFFSALWMTLFPILIGKVQSIHPLAGEEAECHYRIPKHRPAHGMIIYERNILNISAPLREDAVIKYEASLLSRSLLNLQNLPDLLHDIVQKRPPSVSPGLEPVKGVLPAACILLKVLPAEAPDSTYLQQWQKYQHKQDLGGMIPILLDNLRLVHLRPESKPLKPFVDLGLKYPPLFIQICLDFPFEDFARRGMHNKGLLCGVLFVLSTTYIPQMRVPFTIFFAILIDFLPPKPPNRGAKLEKIISLISEIIYLYDNLNYIMFNIIILFYWLYSHRHKCMKFASIAYKQFIFILEF